MDYEKHFARDKEICGGETVIKGTRVPIRIILASLAEGDTIQEIVADFPTVGEEDVRAVIAFARASRTAQLPCLADLRDNRQEY